MGLDQPVDIAVEQRKTLLVLLARCLPNTTAWVYGSRVKWTSRPESDLDLVVFATPEQAGRVADLKEAFEESNLPFRVDLFVWDEVPEQFRKQIDAEHVVLVEKEEMGMAGNDWIGYTVDELKAPEPNALATGPFGSAISSRHFVQDGVPVIRGSNLSQDVGTRLNDDGLVFVSESKAKEFSRSLARTGDLIFTCWGTIDQVGLIDDRSRFREYVVSNKQMKLTPDLRKTSNLFLYYLFSSPLIRNQILNQGIGSSVPGFNLGQLRSMTLNLPSLPEQRGIANILGTLDDKIELNRRMNQTLEEMARALFKSWFVDFDPVHAKATLKHHDTIHPQGGSDWSVERARAFLARIDPNIAPLFPDCFVDSELGLIPKGWEVSEIGKFADVIDCLHSKKPKRRVQGKPLLQLWNIRDDGLLDMADTYFIDDPDYERWVSRLEAVAGDCVITNVGRVGAVAQVPVGLKAALGRNMTGIRCKESSVFPSFLIECLLSRAIRNEISLKIDTGTILESLNVRNIPKLRFVLGANGVISSFEQRVRPLRARMEQNLLESHSLATLRDTLLPKLVSGEIRLKDVYGALEAAV